MYTSQGSVTLTETQVISNSADGHGGGVYVYQGTATLTRTQVVSNSADGHGGGVASGIGVDGGLHRGRGVVDVDRVAAGGGEDVEEIEIVGVADEVATGIRAVEVVDVCGSEAG